jgi:hypothetical protein
MSDAADGLTPLELADKFIKSEQKDWRWFQRRPLDVWYFEAWRLYFNLMLRDEISDAQARAILKELKQRQFTNGNLEAAGDHILTRCRRWPHLVDFTQGKDPTLHNEPEE